MCNLYSMTKTQAAIIAIVRAMRDKTGNLPPLPGIFPDYFAHVVRNAPMVSASMRCVDGECRRHSSIKQQPPRSVRPSLNPKMRGPVLLPPCIRQLFHRLLTRFKEVTGC